jgi:branched-chain amino acid transport system substrate-binding protein
MTRGTEMTVRNINDQGGVNGRKLKLLIADDACDPDLAVQVAEELARQGVVFVDGHFCSGASLPASRVYHERGILMINPASVNSRLTEQGFPNVFRIAGRDDMQGAFAADYVVDNGLAERIAIVHDETAFGQGIADEFRRRLGERGVPVATEETIAQGDRDFSALVARLRDAGIRLVYFGGYHIEGGLFARQAHGQGLEAGLLVNSAMMHREFWDLAGPGGEGVLMTFAPDPRRLPAAAEVVRRYEAEGYSPEGRTLYAYAAVQLFAEAARRAGSTELEALVKALHEGAYDTVLGPSTFDEKGGLQISDVPLARREVRAGLLRSCRRRVSGPAAGTGGHAASAASGTRAGSRTVKVEPRPGSLSASMSPPISRASRRLIARPRPVPP